MPPLILPSGKLATLDGKPVEITQEQFEDCCCGPCPCSVFTGAAPCCFLVRFAGITNGTCEHCDYYNRLFAVAYVGHTATECVWQADIRRGNCCYDCQLAHVTL